MMMKFESKIGAASIEKDTKEPTSFRIIVPKKIMELLDLDLGDKIIWHFDVDSKTMTVEGMKDPKKKKD